MPGPADHKGLENRSGEAFRATIDSRRTTLPQSGKNDGELNRVRLVPSTFVSGSSTWIENIPVLHNAPLQPTQSEHYRAERQIRSKQIRHTSIICQLVVILRIVVNSFFNVAALA